MRARLLPRIGPWWHGVLALLVVASFSADVGARPAYRLGVHYDLIAPAERVFSRQPDRVEVVELFWYGCRSCYAIQKVLADWRRRKGEAIDYVRLPAVTEAAMIPLARAFYAAQELGVVERVHIPLFTAIHAFRRRLDGDEALKRFFGEYGVREDDFIRAYRGTRVADGLRRSRIMGKRYEIRGVPTLVVDGRYRVDASQVSGASQLIDVLDYLVALEQGDDSESPR